MEFKGTERFSVVRELGQGGMGVVFEVVDRESELRCALKVLRKTEPSAILHFKREYRAVQGLNHPNLVRLGELLTDERQWFFTMELVRGVDLATWLQGQRASEPRIGGDTLTLNDDAPAIRAEMGPQSSFERSDLGRLRMALAQLARGLAFLHESGKVHRDVKPSNVLVDSEGRVVILDFGLIAEDTSKKSDSGALLTGTPAYMAPERVLGIADATSDMYAVGIVLFEALTGRHPFGDRSFQALSRRRFLPVPRPSRIAPDVPSDLDELCARLLAIEPGSRPTAREVLDWLGDGQRSTPSTTVSDFRGRDSELSQLAEAYDQSQKRPVLVALKGPSGMGKTATLARFLAQLRARSDAPLVLQGRCYEYEGIPYKAIDGVMDELAACLTREHLAPPEDIALLGVLFPVLGRVSPIRERDAAEDLDVHELRRRAEEACRSLLGMLSSRHPLVVAIDDFQWSDADSRAFLSALARGSDAPPCLFVLSTRTEVELRGLECVRIELEPLPIATARALATELLSRLGGSTDSAADIAAEAAGNPFFVHELARSSSQRGSSGASQPSSMSHLEQVLWERVASLEPGAREVLELMAVAAEPTSQRALLEASGLDIEAFVRIVHRLRSERLLATSATSLTSDTHALEVHHDRIREIVTRKLPDSVRTTRHLRLARSLERHCPDEIARLALHFDAADDPGNAGHYAILAARQARAALAFERAATLYRIAIARLGDQGLELELAESLAGAGIGAEAAEAYLLAARETDRMSALELRRRAAEHLLSSGRLDEGFRGLTAVLDDLDVRLPATKSERLVSLVYHRARARFRRLRFVERDRSEMAPAEVMRVDALWTAAARLGGVDPVAASSFQARHLLKSWELGDHFRFVRALAMEVAFIAVERARSTRRADRLLSVVRRETRALEQPYMNAMLDFVEGVVAFQRGKFRSALASFDRAAERFRSTCTGTSHEVAFSLRFATDSLFHLGETAEMCRRVPHLLADAERRGDLYFAAELRTGTPNVVWLCADRPDEAKRANQAGIAGWSRRAFFLQNYYHLLASTQIALYVGDGEAAHRTVEAAWRELEHSYLLDVPIVHAEAWHLRARAAVACGGPHARNVVSRALRSLRASRLPLARGLEHAIRAGIAAQGGYRSQARRELSAAEQNFGRVDAVMYQRASELLLGSSSRAAELLSRESIQAPRRFACMLIPGFPQGAS